MLSLGPVPVVVKGQVTAGLEKRPDLADDGRGKRKRRYGFRGAGECQVMHPTPGLYLTGASGMGFCSKDVSVKVREAELEGFG